MRNITILFFLLFVGFNSYSCSCVGYGYSLPQAYNSAQIIFEGKIISIKEVDIEEEAGMHYELVFKIEKNLKGAEGKTIKIYTHTQGTACGLRTRKVGEKWIIWAYISKERIYTSKCTNSKLSEELKKEYKDLLYDLASSKEYKIWKDEEGNKIAEGKISNNLAEGKWIYYKKGFPQIDGNYISGKKDGEWIYYNVSENDSIDNSNKKLKIIYKENYKGNELNGISISFYENNKQKKITNYKDGAKNGFSISFYESGIIQLLAFYDNENQSIWWQLYDEQTKLLCESKGDIPEYDYKLKKYICPD
ncbi:hypothetical protein [Flavobacterium macacae]|uniref:Toxin-antitoxin system YwqK family antitoxin n=1 Tax=Flavobacterium macacae TaxID=2488993 RepID=A0A3P3WHS8_9FLAO|nr:hypothetical protein [Flavobacterium macacae]RRJ93846.1 hypothetical protein EG849_03140 [Flavobacterium macacae]